MLPAEIWLHICKQLCIHCDCKEMPDFSFPKRNLDYKNSEREYETSKYQQGTSALAALSLTSRDMRDIAQPVLHHCFYNDSTQNKTSKFLRTLISQPQLANSVRVLALPKSDTHENGCHTRSEIEIWNEVGTRLGIPPPRWINRLLVDGGPIVVPAFEWPAFGPVREDMLQDVRLLAFDGEGQNKRLHIHLTGPTLTFFKDLSLWQQFLLVGICSDRLTHLAVSRIYGPVQGNGELFSDLLGPSHPLKEPFDFSKLRVFSCKKAFFQDDFSSFFSLAPRLNHVAAGSIHWAHHPASSRLTTPTPLNNVRSLAFGCASHDFVDILRLCSQVQDLEFHLEVPPLNSTPTIPSLAPDPWWASIKHQIRRLCWSATVHTGWNALSNEGRYIFPPLEEFQNLEILEIDRVTLEVGLRTTRGLESYTPEELSRQLPDFLPPSIRILHFSFGMLWIWSWSLLLVELEALAAAKMTSLPMLSVIQIDESVRIDNDKTLAQAMEILGVVSAMKDAGIELRFGTDPSISDRQGMRSRLPGNLHGVYGHFRAIPSAENFFLED